MAETFKAVLVKKRLLFFVFAYTVSICLLSAQLAKHSTDRWYAQHWMLKQTPPVETMGEVNTFDKTSAEVWIRTEGKDFKWGAEPAQSNREDIPAKMDKISAGIELTGKYLDLQSKIGTVNGDCLRVTDDIWAAKHCDARIKTLDRKLRQLEKERKALAVSTQ